MARRTFRRVASLLAVPAALLGCSQETPGPVGVQTVRLAVVAGAKHGGRPFTTPMTQEVTSTPVWAGDPDGWGTALLTVNRGQREICWDVSAGDIQLPATASHIHKAAPGVRGPIVVGLAAPGGNGRSVGCATDVDLVLLDDILASPDSYYVNVHTSDYPAGAVRGQLGN